MVLLTCCHLGGCRLNSGRLRDCPHGRLALKLLELVVVGSEVVDSVVVCLKVACRAVLLLCLAWRGWAWRAILWCDMLLLGSYAMAWRAVA